MSKLGNRKGFTMIETLVSVALLLMFFAAVAAIFDVVTHMVGEARIRTIASALAAERVELVRNMTYQDIGTIGGIPDGIIPQDELVNINGQDFNIGTSIIYIDDEYDNTAPSDIIPTDYKRVRVEISWDGPFSPRNPVVMTTDIVPDGLETSEGGGILMVSVINSTGIPVDQAQISITNDTVIPEINLNINTNQEGVIVLPGAPSCSDCYRISATKSGFSSDRTYSISEVTNPLKPDMTVIEGEVTAITLSIDQTANLTVRTTGSRANNYPPFAGIQFRLRGNKVIGTNALDQPVYKYDNLHSSGPGGLITLNAMEPDTYEVWIPAGATVDFAGSAPISPFGLFPGINRDLIIVTEPATPNNLLVVIQNTTAQPVSTASAVISNQFGFIATGSAGALGAADNGQYLFKNLTPGTYQLNVSQLNYQSASTSAIVTGDSKAYVLLENN